MPSNNRNRAPDLATPTAAVAYRKDFEARQGPFGPDDGTWIAIVTIVSQLPLASAGARRTFLDEAGAMAASCFTPAQLDYGCVRDPARVNRRSPIAILRLLVERMEAAGAIHLASCLLDGLTAILPRHSVNAGRVLLHKGRIAIEMGDLGLGLSYARRIRGIGKRTGSAELRIRGLCLYGSVAQARGNVPEVRRLATRVLTLARKHRLPRSEATAHAALGFVEWKAGNLPQAVNHVWESYIRGVGDRLSELSMLSNLGELFVQMSHPKVARKALEHVLAGGPSRIVTIAAIGSYARACAMLGDAAAVQWAADAVASCMGEQVSRTYEFVDTLLACAEALELTGDARLARVFREKGQATAAQCGYNELIFRAERVASAPAPLGAGCVAVAAAIDAFPEAPLPTRLTVGAA